MNYEANKKSVGIAYAFWLLLDYHRFYSGRGGSGVAMGVLGILTAGTLPFAFDPVPNGLNNILASQPLGMLA